MSSAEVNLRQQNAGNSTIIATSSRDSTRRRALKRFARNPAALAGATLLLAMTLAVFTGPLIYQVDPNKQALLQALQLPSANHPFGLDWLGRDLFSRVLHGGRISIALGLPVVAIALVVGTTLGLISGYAGGHVDQVIMGLNDIAIAFPWFLLALLTISVLGPGLYQAMLAVVISFIPRFVRLCRVSTLSAKERDFVLAAHALGQHPSVILHRHVLPNILGPVIVQATSLIGVAVLSAAALGFLGLGVSAPTSEWGSMLSDGRDYMRQNPLVVVAPGLAISLAVLAFNLIGDGLRDALDVRVS